MTDRVEDCRARAAAAEAKAQIARDDQVIKDTYLDIARTWRQMAAKFEQIDQRRHERQQRRSSDLH